MPFQMLYYPNTLNCYEVFLHLQPYFVTLYQEFTYHLRLPGSENVPYKFGVEYVHEWLERLGLDLDAALRPTGTCLLTRTLKTPLVVTPQVAAATGGKQSMTEVPRSNSFWYDKL